MTPQVLTSPVMLETLEGSIPLKYSIEQIPEQPDAQVAATIVRMCQYVCQDYTHPVVQAAAQSALSLDPTNPLGAVHAYVRSVMRFKRDEETAEPFTGLLKHPGAEQGDDYFVEVLTRPVDVCWQFLQTQQSVLGDCDDFASLCAALLMALGIDCAFVTLGADSSDPTVFSHVYVMAFYRGQRVPLDCSHGQYAGWQAPNKYGKYAEWPVADRSLWGGLGIAALLAGWWAWRKGLFS